MTRTSNSISYTPLDFHLSLFNTRRTTSTLDAPLSNSLSLNIRHHTHRLSIIIHTPLSNILITPLSKISHIYSRCTHITLSTRRAHRHQTYLSSNIYPAPQSFMNKVIFIPQQRTTLFYWAFYALHWFSTTADDTQTTSTLRQLCRSQQGAERVGL